MRLYIITPKTSKLLYIKENTNFEERLKTQLWRIETDIFISYSNAFKE